MIRLKFEVKDSWNVAALEEWWDINFGSVLVDGCFLSLRKDLDFRRRESESTAAKFVSSSSTAIKVDGIISAGFFEYFYTEGKPVLHLPDEDDFVKLMIEMRNSLLYMAISRKTVPVFGLQTTGRWFLVLIMIFYLMFILLSGSTYQLYCMDWAGVNAIAVVRLYTGNLLQLNIDAWLTFAHHMLTLRVRYSFIHAMIHTRTHTHMIKTECDISHHLR